MGRTFADSLDEDLAGAFLDTNEFAQEVVFTRADDAATTATVDAVVSRERGEQSPDAPGLIVAYVRTFTTRFPGAYAPAITDVVTVGGVTYALRELGNSDGDCWRGELVRKTAVEVTRDHYRRTR